MKILIAGLLIILALSINSFAQGSSEYTVRAVKGDYVIIGEKPYKMLTKCEGIKA